MTPKTGNPDGSLDFFFGRRPPDKYPAMSSISQQILQVEMITSGTAKTITKIVAIQLMLLPPPSVRLS
jgi:hypothetical protein